MKDIKSQSPGTFTFDKLENILWKQYKLAEKIGITSHPDLDFFLSAEGNKATIEWTANNMIRKDYVEIKYD